MYNFTKAGSLAYLAIFCISLFVLGCDPNATPTNTGNSTNIPNSNAENVNTENTNMTSPDNSGEMSSNIETSEPEKYQGTINLNFEAMGEGTKMTLPKLAAMVARDGDNKRMEFSLPNSQKVIYLEQGGKNFVVLPDRKQYAELNAQSTGFQVRSLMTPEQIVSRAKSVKGLEKVGEEKYNGRDAVKYEYKGKTETNSTAGEVDTDSVVYVDKETNLPLRTVTSSMSEGNVKGYKGLRLITEMSDIKTDVSEDMFEIPEGFQKVEEEQIRNQINLIFSAVGAFLQQAMQSANSAPSNQASNSNTNN